ncbi:hypothetical protein MNBD_CHLOROFLEXI01-2079 [hydrothermal vent metagenome]|uniref:Halogenase n=1 Tax=hydrothermal vent metagenome TaxID=652676 RepID=A0A3B0VBK1_9ZZZZ
MRIAMIGNGIVSNMGALYFKQRLPESVEIVLIGPDERGGLPLVGESIIEITANFLENYLGLEDYLRENHLPKHALTYYFKLDPDNPDDRTYSVHGTASLPNPNGYEGSPGSWQLSRESFDNHLRKLVAENSDIERINGRVTDVQIDGEAGHTLEVKEADGNRRSLKVDWIIDASGRNRLLAKKLGLTIRPEGQRDCFWFRIADFDRSLLKELNALGPNPPAEGESGHYDRYYTTHHFMGHGNWIWMIPLKTDDGSELMSIGFVSHPDHYDHDVRSIDSFIEQVSKVHPVVTDFVKSGRIVDTNLLRRYHYVTNPVYSPDRWGVVGDAAFAPDPLFSNGLAFVTLQLEQLGMLIAEDCAGKHSAELVEKLAQDFLGPVISSQTTISNWYPTMDDAFLSSIRINWIETVYFYLFLPLVINRCHFDPKRLKLWKALQIRQDDNPFDIPKELIEARSRVDKPLPDHFVYKGMEKLNPKARIPVGNLNDLYDQLEAGSGVLAKYTKELLDRVDKLEGELTMA